MAADIFLGVLISAAHRFKWSARSHGATAIQVIGLELDGRGIRPIRHAGNGD